MFPSISKLCLGLAIATGCLLPAERLFADDWSDVDVDDRVLQIETTDINDMVYVAINPFADDELAIHILHFVSNAPSLDIQSLEQAIAAADDYRIESRRLDRTTKSSSM
ncbi:hypothetical protein [Rhodopirellula halodulae]|uniref:hypothetical protein n=1 Tax=Rhodopirellula halodulae TaxID=2894198 RepID=UPI001E47D780|nr:hypothetical protein [Rhodopirellula sp. JC737]MCC9655085.1 hypothetical protein [Rhodopirellula sp. JC737]